jgi:NADH-quinone oxidoreductase subunit N
VEDIINNIAHSFSWMLPEWLLLLTALLLMTLDLWSVRSKHLVSLLMICAIVSYTGVIAYSLYVHQPFTEVALWNNHLVLSKSSILFKMIGLVGTVFFIANAYFSYSLNELKREPMYFAKVFIMLFALNIVVMSKHVLPFVISLELLSLVSYLLCSVSKSETNVESSLKYFVFGAFSSALMWYGISLLYGLSGSMLLHDWQAYFMDHANDLLVLPAILLFFGGVLFKLSVFPFHFWVPDVYEGLPAPVAGFISSVPKVAVMWFFWQVYPFHSPTTFGWGVCAVLFALTLASGNFPALLQKDAQRMMGYSSVAHSGFMVLAFLLPGKDPSIFIFYLMVYVLMSNALFYTIDTLHYTTGSTKIEDFKGVGIRFPMLGVLIFILMVSLTGLPPTAGFYAKFFVFTGLWEAYQQTEEIGYVVLVIWGIVNTLISLYYYLRIPFYSFFKRKENDIKLTFPKNISLILLTLYMIPLLVFFLKPEWVLQAIKYFIQQ